MPELFNNSWIIGIGGGILSGLIVTFITRYLFSKRDHKEYLQKIDTVNREVIYALRPGISEGHIPTDDVLTSLINATARKYKVSRDDAFKSNQIAEELIKEIMDSSFISSDTKKSYCDTLAHLVKQSEPVVKEMGLVIEQKAAESDYREKTVFRMSAILGLTVTLVTMTSVLLENIKSENVSVDIEKARNIKELFDLLLPTLSFLAAALLATVAILVYVKLKGFGEENRNKENSSEKDSEKSE